VRSPSPTKPPKRSRHDSTKSRTWDAVLIDEFQDLNPVQYQIIKALAIGKKPDANIFAVGDYDQSIHGWAGAESKVFSDYQNDFKIIRPIALLENRRCPRNVFQLARLSGDFDTCRQGIRTSH
jgi:superfamily I DNA/RNA helicase